MVSISTRGNHPIVACAGRFGCMEASPFIVLSTLSSTAAKQGRAKAKTDPLFGGTMHRPRSHQRLAGPFAHLGTRKQARAKRGTDPALSQNPADNRIDLACPIQSETAPNNFRDHQSTHFLLTPSTPKCSAEGCRRHRRTSAI